MINTSEITSGEMTYSWTFGDGGISDDPAPTHVYEAASGNSEDYSIALTVTSVLGGCVDQTTRQVKVWNPTIEDQFWALPSCVLMMMPLGS